MRRLGKIALVAAILVGWLCFVLLLQSLGTVTQAEQQPSGSTSVSVSSLPSTSSSISTSSAIPPLPDLTMVAAQWSSELGAVATYSANGGAYLGITPPGGTRELFALSHDSLDGTVRLYMYQDRYVFIQRLRGFDSYRHWVFDAQTALVYEVHDLLGMYEGNDPYARVLWLFSFVEKSVSWHRQILAVYRQDDIPAWCELLGKEDSSLIHEYLGEHIHFELFGSVRTVSENGAVTGVQLADELRYVQIDFDTAAASIGYERDHIPLDISSSGRYRLHRVDLWGEISATPSRYGWYLEDTSTDSFSLVGYTSSYGDGFDQVWFLIGDDYVCQSRNSQTGMVIFDIAAQTRLDFALEIPEGRDPDNFYYENILQSCYDPVRGEFLVFELDDYISPLKSESAEWSVQWPVSISYYDWQGRKTDSFPLGLDATITDWGAEVPIHLHIENNVLSFYLSQGGDLSHCHLDLSTRELATERISGDEYDRRFPRNNP